MIKKSFVNFYSKLDEQLRNNGAQTSFEVFDSAFSEQMVPDRVKLKQLKLIARNPNTNVVKLRQSNEAV